MLARALCLLLASVCVSFLACLPSVTEKKLSKLQQCNRLIDQAHQLIQQMELEVRSLDSGTRKELTKKVRQYKASLKSLDDDYQRVKEKEERDGLLGAREGMEMVSIEQRGRMRAATDK